MSAHVLLNSLNSLGKSDKMRGFRFIATSLFLGQTCILYRESYMSAQVLLTSLNEFRKSDKTQGLPSIISFFETS